jgi:hypothetical protein
MAVDGIVDSIKNAAGIILGVSESRSWIEVFFEGNQSNAAQPLQRRCWMKRPTCLSRLRFRRGVALRVNETLTRSIAFVKLSARAI